MKYLMMFSLVLMAAFACKKEKKEISNPAPSNPPAIDLGTGKVVVHFGSDSIVIDGSCTADVMSDGTAFIEVTNADHPELRFHLDFSDGFPDATTTYPLVFDYDTAPPGDNARVYFSKMTTDETLVWMSNEVSYPSGEITLLRNGEVISTTFTDIPLMPQFGTETGYITGSFSVEHP